MAETRTRRRQRITIVGTGCIGASIGLALRHSEDADHLEVVGHDRDAGRARQAQKLGAFDATPVNLDVALGGAQLVILAVPLASLREVLQDVGRLLDPGRQEHAPQALDVVVTDVGPLKQPAIEWASATLPASAHFVGGDPFLAPGLNGWEPLRGLEDASEELFREAVYAIAARADDHPSAVRTVANLALVLGATPLFMDPVEHDAVRLMAGTVPSLVAVSLFQATAASPGWEEVRKAAGREFATATAGVSGDVDSQRMSALLGRETVLRGLDEVLARLTELRASIAEGDAAALEAQFAAASQGRAAWMLQSQTRAWQLNPQAMVQGGLFSRTLQTLLGGGITGKSGE
jgi:prephenate dehydrogenase